MSNAASAPCKAIIFDLDNCVCDARAAGEDLFAPAFEAIARANDGHVPEDRLREAFEACWSTSFDLVAQRYGFSRPMFDAGFAVFARLEVTQPLQGYPDLPVLKALGVPTYLVTSGFQRLQESKIRALGIRPWFTGVVIDAVDVPPHRGKKKIFEDILREGGYAAREVAAVGDNPLSELAAGRELGMRTVQTLRPGVDRADADFHVRSFEALRTILSLPAAAPSPRAP